MKKIHISACKGAEVDFKFKESDGGNLADFSISFSQDTVCCISKHFDDAFIIANKTPQQGLMVYVEDLDNPTPKNDLIFGFRKEEDASK